jgi:hypothetical protein
MICSLFAICSFPRWVRAGFNPLCPVSNFAVGIALRMALAGFGGYGTREVISYRRRRRHHELGLDY